MDKTYADTVRLLLSIAPHVFANDIFVMKGGTAINLYKHRQFLLGLARAQPDWTLLQHPHIADLPALRWKLRNLETFSKNRPADFNSQAEMLEKGLLK